MVYQSVDPAGLTMDRRWLSKPTTRDMDPAIMYPAPLSYPATVAEPINLERIYYHHYCSSSLPINN